MPTVLISYFYQVILILAKIVRFRFFYSQIPSIILESATTIINSSLLPSNIRDIKHSNVTRNNTSLHTSIWHNNDPHMTPSAETNRVQSAMPSSHVSRVP